MHPGQLSKNLRFENSPFLGNGESAKASQESSQEPRSVRDGRIPSLKTPSFKEEKKRPQNWFRRQFSGQMNQDSDSNRIEQATAVAAAAYAITSLYASSIPEQKKIGKRPEPLLTQTKSKRQELTDLIPESGRTGKQFSGEGSMRRLERQDSKVTETATKEKTTSKVATAAPEIKRTLTFTDKSTPSMKKTPSFAENAEPIIDEPTVKPKITVPKPDLPPTRKPLTPPTKIKREVSTRPGIDGTDADAWERAELSKIQKRYEEMNARILSWENKKKEKAKNRLKKTELSYLLDPQSDLAQIQSKALKQFHDEIVDIDQIAGAAKAKAAERQRNKEFKAKEKANTIRKTGKLPRTLKEVELAQDIRHYLRKTTAFDLRTLTATQICKIHS
ncbi:unnamed protein product [Dovyalis caffra]|uniref:Remorin C-terminal domain-containing protein n=1 Tax=Dovyalis caffra TaxID=77055 RepID=A0AAV1QWS4_9ROSI|nr:unnamed protein product [Dovyalis caffra]